MKANEEKVLLKSNRDEWETPASLFEQLDREFQFDLDACATDENAKCERYFTKEQDGLAQDWRGYTVWCNPPYSQFTYWAAKCFREGCQDNTIVVCLLPARTDTKYFHNYIYHHCEIRFIKGRLKFGNAKPNASFPGMVCIFRGPVVTD